ncbi:MAG: hypothetical protein AAGB10_18915 [Pseudomonadota bacterium]
MTQPDPKTVNRAVAAAADFAADYEGTDALFVLLGRQEKGLENAPEQADNPRFDPEYDESHMGVIDTLREAGQRVVMGAADGLHQLICGAENPDTEKNRQALLNAVGLSEATAIGATTTLLLTLPAITPMIAAAAAVVIVRLFLIPAGEDLCEFWAEKLEAKAL